MKIDSANTRQVESCHRSRRAPITIVAQLLWRGFRSSSLWQMLHRVHFFRSGVYLGIEVWRRFSERDNLSKESIDRQFRLQDDPFKYNSPGEARRFMQQAKILDCVKKGKFQNVLEIGCAEGLFTQMLAAKSQSLTVLDISPTALAKTRDRKDWGDCVHFSEWDLKHDAVPGSFDLIVAAGVLEYVYGFFTFRKVRAKLVGALWSGGYLLVQSTKVNSVVENAWWGKYIIRGERINEFFRQDKRLQVIDWITADQYVITLFRRDPQSHDSLDYHSNIQP